MNDKNTNKTYYTCYETWKRDNKSLGWVHCHDEFVVIDDEHGFCIGEWDSIEEVGWINKNEI